MVIQSNLRYFRFHLRVVTAPAVIGQTLHSFTRPQVSDCVILTVYGLRHINVLRIFSLSGHTTDVNRAGRLTPPFAEQDNRLLRIERRQNRRLKIISIHTLENHFDIRQHRRLYVCAELVRYRRRFCLVGYDKRLSLPDRRDSLDQITVYGGADTEGKEIRLPHIVPNHIEHFRFSVYVSVAYDHDIARRIFRRRNPQRILERGRQFGAAGSLLLFNQPQSLLHILLCGRKRTVRHLQRISGK